MEIIKLHHPYNKKEIPQQDTVLVLGFFDGVHRGHQAVINEGKKIAKEKDLKLAVMTFNRHPAIVYTRFNPDQHYYLTTLQRKETIMEKIGVDILYEVDFTAKFGSLSPQDFVDDYIVGLNAKVAVAGFDYTYGKPEVASMEHLNQYAQNRFEVITVSPKIDKNGKISSTRIRKAIKEGKVGLAADLLGYYFETEGFVIHGDARGRTLGYPTANIYPDPYLLLPKRGVYAVELFVNDKWYRGMASIGYNITFEKRRNYSVEVHLFDFNEVIYGENVRVKWVEFLRDEIKFDSAESLVEQLGLDEIKARDILWKRKSTMLM
ncbi:riboflavin biosynthesis protein RibF [Lacticigenium naphthae]|uniref:riboflavin biosynthesis protein RibF n=1 Tax=Lacticigenium naphthae TaxID=515351 RepID=UPI0003F9DB22|nr:riboflavin biosynthesis protein RibF [Lacticigenium naphthae]